VSVKNGTRPGTKPDANIPGSEYVMAIGGKWDKIRSLPRETMRWEGEVQTAIASVEKMKTALEVAYILVHGGHVDKGTMAASGLTKKMTPEKVVEHVKGLMPKNLDKFIHI